MTKNEFINQTAKKSGYRFQDAAAIIEAALAVASDALITGDALTFRNFGTLKQKIHPARPARNPRTGEEFHKPERRSVQFVAAEALTKKVNEE